MAKGKSADLIATDKKYVGRHLTQHKGDELADPTVVGEAKGNRV